MFQPWDLESGVFDDSGFAGVAMSRQLVRFWQHFWLEAELGAGFRFELAEDYYNPELWGAIYLKFDGFPAASPVNRTRSFLGREDGV